MVAVVPFTLEQAFVAAVSPASNISLTAPSQAFIDNRETALGPWVLGGFTDCILLGVVLCQVQHYFKTRISPDGNRSLHTYNAFLVCFVTLLAVLKTSQAMAVVYVQNIIFFNNPDIARTLVAKAWWQVSVPLMTGLTGFVVQSFFAYRFWMLTRQWLLCIPIIAAMCLGITGSALSVFNIVIGDAKAKVLWLLVHLICVFLADFMITAGTFWALKRNSNGLPSTVSLVNRLVRMVFESALPPTIFAALDLILTQTLGKKLLWHLLLNYPLSKLYIISLLYTLNCTNDYRRRNETNSRTRSQDIYSKDVYVNRRGDMELGSRLTAGEGIRVQTSITTHHDVGSLSPITKSGVVRGNTPIDVRDLQYDSNHHRLTKSETGSDEYSPDWTHSRKYAQ